MDFTRDPWLTPYARLLIVKVFGASAVLALAAYNKYRLTPRLFVNETGAAAALQRSINVELILIGVVATLTAILTTYLSPHDWREWGVGWSWRAESRESKSSSFDSLRLLYDSRLTVTHPAAGGSYSRW